MDHIKTYYCFILIQVYLKQIAQLQLTQIGFRLKPAPPALPPAHHSCESCDPG